MFVIVSRELKKGQVRDSRLLQGKMPCFAVPEDLAVHYYGLIGLSGSSRVERFLAAAY